MESNVLKFKRKPISTDKFHEVYLYDEYIGYINFDGMWNLHIYENLQDKTGNNQTSHFKLSDAKAAMRKIFVYSEDYV